MSDSAKLYGDRGLSPPYIHKGSETMSYDLISNVRKKAAAEGDKEPDQGHVRRSARFWFNIDEWPLVLKLAQIHGWEPEGTQPSFDDQLMSTGGAGDTDADTNADTDTDTDTDEHTDEHTDKAYSGGEWSGTYLLNRMQSVTNSDAAALADAVEQALEHIPAVPIDKQLENRRVLYLENSDGPEEVVDKILERFTDDFTKEADPHLQFSGPAHKEKLENFVAFCRRGGFTIA
ncbi:MAG: hypothetical protein LC641_12375 [Spirochaeta sp.]|nr:hypothetical protein [Spirochaeta sp.]